MTTLDWRDINANWRDASQYSEASLLGDPNIEVEDGDTVSPIAHKWAWQFLRRNENYREDFDEFNGRNHARARRYGMYAFLSYKLPSPHFVPFLSANSSSIRMLPKSTRRVHMWQEPTELIYKLDCNLPFTAHLRLLRTAYSEAQNEIASTDQSPPNSPDRMNTFRLRPEKLGTYLRVLDAYIQEGKGSRKKIAEQLIFEKVITAKVSDREYDGERKVGEYISEAREVRDNRFLRMILAGV